MGKRQNPKNLVWRDRVAYMRVDVPVDVRGSQPFGKKTQVMKSLGTRDPREAERKLHAELALFHATCEQVRIERSPAFQEAKASAVFLARPSPGEELAAARLLLNGSPEEIRSAARERLDQLADELGGKQVTAVTVSVVDGEGVESDVRLPPHVALSSVDHARDLIVRDRASLDQSPQRPNGSAHGADQNPTLRSLFERWIRERKPSKATANNYESSLNAFERIHGELGIRDLTAAHVRDFKDRFVDADAKPATINKHLSALRAITHYAKANDLINVDPAAAIKLIAQVEGDKRKVFAVGELGQLFDGVSRGSPEWWVMRVALFTGMRQDEICQLTRGDVAQVDGVWLFDVNGDKGKRVKNKQSIRRVPIHQRLLNEGLIRLLPGAGRLFSYFKETPGKRAAQRVSRWFTDYRRSVGVAEPYKDFHSFRHTFITAARIVMAEEDYVQITGHKSDERVNRAYGTYSLAKLKQEIDKVDWAI